MKSSKIIRYFRNHLEQLFSKLISTFHFDSTFLETLFFIYLQEANFSLFRADKCKIFKVKRKQPAKQKHSWWKKKNWDEEEGSKTEKWHSKQTISTWWIALLRSTFCLFPIHRISHFLSSRFFTVVIFSSNGSRSILLNKGER